MSVTKAFAAVLRGKYRFQSQLAFLSRCHLIHLVAQRFKGFGNFLGNVGFRGSGTHYKVDILAANPVIEHPSNVLFQAHPDILFRGHIFGHKTISKLRFFEFPAFLGVYGNNEGIESTGTEFHHAFQGTIDRVRGFVGKWRR